MNETGWVIEAAGPKYWTGVSVGTDAFSSDPALAVRFCRSSDASAVLYRCFKDEYVRLLAVREHVWLAAPTGTR